MRPEMAYLESLVSEWMAPFHDDQPDEGQLDLFGYNDAESYSKKVFALQTDSVV